MAEARRWRISAQRLIGERPTRVADLVRDVFAIPAQDLSASRLAVRPRSQGLDRDAVIRACNRDRSVVRTWAMRGTLHMLVAEDVTWLVGLLGPQIAAADSRRRRQLGLDDDLGQRALRAIPQILSNGPITRVDLVADLDRRGIRIDQTTNAAAHLCLYAAALGLICRGPDQEDGEPTYVLLDDWLGSRRRRHPKDPLAELATRYLAAHGPADPHDLAAWAGISFGQARRAFHLNASRLTEVEVAGRPQWVLAGAAEPDGPRGRKPEVRLLGAFDPYLLGYADRDLALSPRFASRIQAGGGWIHPALTVDGFVMGTWRQRRSGAGISVELEPFEPLDRRLAPLLQAEIGDLIRFLGAGGANASVPPP